VGSRLRGAGGGKYRGRGCRPRIAPAGEQIPHGLDARADFFAHSAASAKRYGYISGNIVPRLRLSRTFLSIFLYARSITQLYKKIKKKKFLDFQMHGNQASQ
jgi:hypothetical protein